MKESLFHTLDPKNPHFIHDDAVEEHHNTLSDWADHSRLSDSEKDHLIHYTEDGAGPINGALIRNEERTDGKSSMDADDLRTIGHINSAMNKQVPLQNEGHFYSGIGTMFTRKLHDLRVGDTVHSSAFISTSIDHTVPENFGHHTDISDLGHDMFFHKHPDHPYWSTPNEERPQMRTTLHFHTPVGFQHGIYLGTDEDGSRGTTMLSGHPAEHEYLLRNGLRWKVAHIEMHDEGDGTNIWNGKYRKYHKVVTLVPHEDQDKHPGLKDPFYLGDTR